MNSYSHQSNFDSHIGSKNERGKEQGSLFF